LFIIDVLYWSVSRRYQSDKRVTSQSDPQAKLMTNSLGLRQVEA